MCHVQFIIFFFFQAEDGIRDWSVTGVQTCALPIYKIAEHLGFDPAEYRKRILTPPNSRTVNELRVTSTAADQCIDEVVARKIGRASCRERVEIAGGAEAAKEKKKRAE